ncbi:MAG: Ribosomal RNA small subunit methyltransferase C [Candidatus Erwinia impunctatus]|nr:Ribosomal RNA small subunit methyltransferase C [Culicoides impunctatus]
MSAFTPASEVILRHSDQFTHRRVLFAGDLQDTLPAQLSAAHIQVHTQQYHHWQRLQSALGERVEFSLIASAESVTGCDTLIYLWPKNKAEARFQLDNLLSLLPTGSDLFIVGENRSGVRSATEMLADVASLVKIDSARRCGLYHARLDAATQFDLSRCWAEYALPPLVIKTLPGVFSRDALDTGSQLLIPTFKPHMKGKVLDIGCGAGVLSVCLARLSPKVRLTLSDVSAAAIASGKATLEANQISGEVIASNVYSDIAGRFDMIMSNPPFHEGMQTSLDAARTLITGAAKHLNTGGELRIVANSFLPYPQLLDETFGSHEVLAQTGRFKVYRAIWRRTVKAG